MSVEQTNAKVSIDQLLFKNLYYRYQQFVAPVVVIVVCLLLFLFVVTPQMQNFFALRDALNVDIQNGQIMRQNLALITSINDATLSNELQIATQALPTQKDFTGIVASLQQAAAVAQTSLGDYSFSLGDLSGLDQSGKSTQLPVTLTVTIKGTVSQAQQFVAQLRRQLPLSDTLSVVVNSDTSCTITVVFYYANLPKISFGDTTPLPLLSQADIRLLQSLAANNTLSSAPLVASSSPKLSPSVSPKPTVTPAISATPASSSAK